MYGLLFFFRDTCICMYIIRFYAHILQLNLNFNINLFIICHFLLCVLVSIFIDFLNIPT
jgi:hypothetical protein